MAKNLLKAWLVDNTVTTDDKTDKIFQLESARNLNQDQILDRMMAKNPGVRRETMALSVSLYHEVVQEEVLNGASVNTDLFRAVAQFRGVTHNGAWNPAANSIYVSLTQGKALREAIADTTVDVLGERPVKFYIGSSSDAATRATDFSATAGRPFTIYGKNILPAGPDASVGVSLTNVESKAVTRLTADMIALAEPSRLILLIPAGLADGEYTLTVTTQYRGSSTDFLKMPRSTSQSIYIGGVPDGGEGGGGNDGGGGETPDPAA